MKEILLFFMGLLSMMISALKLAGLARSGGERGWLDQPKVNVKIPAS